VIPLEAGILLFALLRESFRCFAAGNFLSGDKKSPKNT
jgi:hypothetical protein